MEERNKIILLYDCYGELLSSIQKKYFEDYYFNNLSLSEIATDANVSRNAIHKQLKTIVEKLQFFEDKLNLIDKKNKILKEINDSNLKEKINDIIEG